MARFCLGTLILLQVHSESGQAGLQEVWRTCAHRILGVPVTNPGPLFELPASRALLMAGSGARRWHRVAEQGVAEEEIVGRSSSRLLPGQNIKGEKWAAAGFTDTWIRWHSEAGGGVCRGGVKVEAVRLLRERDVSVAQAARDLDLHENVLRKWVQQLADDPLEAFPGRGRIDYIERFYNPRRRHSTIGYISPMDFEQRVRLA
jgi:Transposase